MWYAACYVEHGSRVCFKSIVHEVEMTMAETGTLHDAFLEELRDTYDAEKQLTKALPKIAKAASSPNLRAAIEAHLEETRGHVERLEEVFATLDEKVRGKHCEGHDGRVPDCRWSACGTLRDGCLWNAHSLGAGDGTRRRR